MTTPQGNTSPRTHTWSGRTKPRAVPFTRGADWPPCKLSACDRPADGWFWNELLEQPIYLCQNAAESFGKTLERMDVEPS
jgi:hypothetical protein